MAGPPFRVSHVVLDVDGTLVDFDRALRQALAATAERFAELTGTALAPSALQQARNLVAAEPQWRRRPLYDARVESFRRLLAQAGVTDEGAATEQLSETFSRTRNETTTVYPDVIETLEALRGAGLTLIAASNGNLDLEAPGLARYFDATLFAEDAEFLKPDPRFFAQAVERGGGTPAVAAAVGDRLDNDYEPALAAGLHAVLIDRDGEVNDPAVLRIGSLTELPALLAPVSADG